MPSGQDLDSAAAIQVFVRRFYDRLLADPELAPLFLEVAGIDIEAHRPRIEAIWRKLLLGDPRYQRHMMDIHRQVHRRQPFRPGHFRRWLGHFEATLAAADWHGPLTDRARFLAHNIAANLEEALVTPDQYRQRRSATVKTG